MNITQYINSTDADERYDFESHVFENVWYAFVKHLPNEPDDQWNTIDVWHNEQGDEILCRTEELAEMIANMIEEISGEHEVHTGYYDPEEDEQEPNGPFLTSGWWYVNYD